MTIYGGHIIQDPAGIVRRLANNNFMEKFPVEAVGASQDKRLTMSNSETIREILERLSMIFSGASCNWAPEGEFCFRLRTSKDRIFRVRDFEGKRTDGEPVPGGIDLLGKYTLSDSTITIYVDSCRRVVRRYLDGNSLEELIRVVLIHELAHLITYRGYLKIKNEVESDHFWEYTAQCATYAYLKEHGDGKALEVFERLSPHQPFIYRTWEGLKVLDRGDGIYTVVRQIFCALFPPIEKGNSGWKY